MEYFRMIGVALGMMGFIVVISASSRMAKLEERLDKAGILPKELFA